MIIQHTQWALFKGYKNGLKYNYFEIKTILTYYVYVLNMNR